MSEAIELKTGELFAGAGGLALGFILANHPYLRFRPLFAIDNDTYSLNTFKYNVNWLVQNAKSELQQSPGIFLRNIEELNVAAVIRLFKLQKGELDLLLGGPPCQGFSSANRQGKQQQKENTNKLIKVFLDKLDEFRPKMFLIENVQGVKWTKPTKDMFLDPTQETLFPDYANAPINVQEFLVRKSNALGYYVWSDILNAIDFGVPQVRSRFFLFGIRADLVSNKDDVTLKPYLEMKRVKAQQSVINAIGDLPRLDNGEHWTGDDYHPSDNDYVKTMRRFMLNGDLHDHFTTKHAEYVIERYKRIPEGGNWASIKDQMTNYKKVENTHSNIYRRLLRDAPAITISHYRKSMLIHPTQHRGISFREACRLQSFPDWFRFQGPIEEQQQQLGNAVPPLMAAAVAWAIGEFWVKLGGSRQPTL
jgi:DNA-cytosine methyltransferase